jgi:hypothetical protein
LTQIEKADMIRLSVETAFMFDSSGVRLARHSGWPNEKQWKIFRKKRLTQIEKADMIRISVDTVFWSVSLKNSLNADSEFTDKSKWSFEIALDADRNNR